MFKIIRHITLYFALLVIALPKEVRAQDIEHPSDDFVIASVLIASPGGALYSRVGHAAIRMQCPEHNLDYVFSYETEKMDFRVLSFLAGNLRMGLFAIPTQDYLSSYEEEGRGVKEYELNLPIEAKQNLWRVLDNHMIVSSDLPYDYLKRGCAYSTLNFLCEGITPYILKYGMWSEKYNLTRREITGLQMSKYPWTWAFLNLICNGEIDKPCVKADKVIMPTDLIEVLNNATIDGQPILGEASELLPKKSEPQIAWFTPLMTSVLLLVLTIVAIFLKKHFMDYALLVIQTLLGSITMYLVLFSNLCCTEWSWLIIPFNILPLLLWKWRCYWARPYAVVLLLWTAFMIFWTSRLTDTTYIVLAINLAIMYWNIDNKYKIFVVKPKTAKQLR